MEVMCSTVPSSSSQRGSTKDFYLNSTVAVQPRSFRRSLMKSSSSIGKILSVLSLNDFDVRLGSTWSVELSRMKQCSSYFEVSHFLLQIQWLRFCT